MNQDLLSPYEKLRLLVEHRPWEGEPDHAEWIDERTGYLCEIHRHPELLHLNGYVYVPNGHPCHGMDYNDGNDLVSVHGGLTYSEKLDRGKKFGFDTSHAGDLSPGLLLTMLDADKERDWSWKYDVYRDWNYVKTEVENLAVQLHKVSQEFWNGYGKTGS